MVCATSQVYSITLKGMGENERRYVKDESFIASTYGYVADVADV